MTLPETRDYLLDELARETVESTRLMGARAAGTIPGPCPEPVEQALVDGARARLTDRFAGASVGALRQAVVAARLANA